MRFAAASIRAAPKRTDLSSGLKEKGSSEAEWVVSLRAGPPSAGMRKTSKLP